MTIHRSIVTKASQPPVSASTTPGSSSSATAFFTGVSDSDRVMVARLVRSFREACRASSASRSAWRVLSSPSSVTTSLSLVAWSISSRIRATLARCEVMRLSTSTTCSVTSCAFAVRSISLPVPSRSARTSA